MYRYNNLSHLGCTINNNVYVIAERSGTKKDQVIYNLTSDWVSKWLDDIGLPQYKDQFFEARVDSRMLNYITVVGTLSIIVVGAICRYCVYNCDMYCVYDCGMYCVYHCDMYCVYYCDMYCVYDCDMYCVYDCGRFPSGMVHIPQAQHHRPITCANSAGCKPSRDT